MGATEIVLIIAGIIAFALGYILPARKKNMGDELQLIGEDEVRKLVDRETEGVKEHIADIVDETITYAMEKAERSMERLTNEKIMAVNEYSDTVLEEINKNHKEVLFLYDMLNDKDENLKTVVADSLKLSEEIKQTVRDTEITAREMQGTVREMQEAIHETQEAVRETQDMVQNRTYPAREVQEPFLADMPAVWDTAETISARMSAAVEMPEEIPAGINVAREMPEETPAGMNVAREMPEEMPVGIPAAGKLPEEALTGISAVREMQEAGMGVARKVSEEAPAEVPAVRKLPEEVSAGMPTVRGRQEQLSTDMPAVLEKAEAESFVPFVPRRVEIIHGAEADYVAEEPKSVDLRFVNGKENTRNSNDRILELHKAGKSNMAIARELGLGIGEVKLVIDLFEGL